MIGSHHPNDKGNGYLRSFTVTLPASERLSSATSHYIHLGGCEKLPRIVHLTDVVVTGRPLSKRELAVRSSQRYRGSVPTSSCHYHVSLPYFILVSDLSL